MLPSFNKQLVKDQWKPKLYSVAYMRLKYFGDSFLVFLEPRGNRRAGETEMTYRLYLYAISTVAKTKRESQARNRGRALPTCIVLVRRPATSGNIGTKCPSVNDHVVLLLLRCSLDALIVEPVFATPQQHAPLEELAEATFVV